MSTGGAYLRSCSGSTGKAIAHLIIIITIVSLSFSHLALGEHYVMQIGSKSNPNAHLFSYDQKFEEATYLHNYELGMSASKEFTDATRLATSMDLRTQPNLTEIMINADFIGTGRIGYLVLDTENGDTKNVHETNVMSDINHMFVGNFSLNEQIRVAKEHMDGDYGCGCTSIGNMLEPV